MALTFDPRSFEQMTALQAQLEIALERANQEHVEAAVAIFALLRCARRLLILYPPEMQRMLLQDVILPFLFGEPPEGAQLNDPLGLLH
jgi:hypothetical protein